MDGKHFSESPFNADYSEGFILGPTLCLLCINGFSDDVFCIIAISAMIYFFLSIETDILICGSSLF